MFIGNPELAEALYCPHREAFAIHMAELRSRKPKKAIPFKTSQPTTTITRKAA